MASPAAYFKAVIDVSADAVIAVDESRRIEVFNHGASVIFGYTSDEIVGCSLSLLLPDATQHAYWEHVRVFTPGDTPIALMTERLAIHGRRKTGEIFPAEALLSHVRIDGRSHFTVVVRDNTVRSQMDSARQGLLARERQARADAERGSARAGLLARASTLFDVSMDVDHALATLARLCVPELASLCVLELVDDDGSVRREFVRHHAPGSNDVIEGCEQDIAVAFAEFLTRPALADGRSLLVRRLSEADLPAFAGDERCLTVWRRLSATSYMCAPLRSGGRIAGAMALVAGDGQRRFDNSDLALLDDIASRASLAMENARLLAKARDAATLRDDVLAIVSHDLRNPLATISMALGRLEDERESVPADRSRLLQIARDSVDWMEHMIQDLLDIANIDAGRLSIEPTPVDLVVLLVRAGALFEQRFADETIELTLDLPESLPSIRADYDRILQVVGNLLSNAAKFTPVGGRVTLSASAQGSEVVASVGDTGRGIPCEDLPRLFDRFWQSRRGAKTRGTGLGLSIAKGIVDAHGGRIWVDSVVAGGSVFSFALPCAETSSSDAAARGHEWSGHP